MLNSLGEKEFQKISLYQVPETPNWPRMLVVFISAVLTHIFRPNLLSETSS